MDENINLSNLINDKRKLDTEILKLVATFENKYRDFPIEKINLNHSVDRELKQRTIFCQTVIEIK